jgi:aminobenzoyl-glutamate utilization protein B
MVEFKSVAKLEEYLGAHGFTFEKGVAGMETAFIASWGSGKPVIGILGEYDALPNLSQTKGTLESKPIVEGAPGHGCGHNLYAASGAAAAIATVKAMEEHGIQGTIRYYGTPAEETGIGKNFMAREGAWDDCDIVISWHPGTSNGVGYSTNLANTAFKAQFYGRSSHAGSSPHAGRSALDAVELFNVGMNYMREHLVDNVRIQYVITSGGEAPNVVPHFAEAWYLLRARHRPIVDHMYEWAQQIAEGAAMMTQTRVEIRLIKAQWETLPNRELAKVGDMNATLIGAPPFDDEDQSYGEEVAKVLETMGVEEIESPYFDTEIDHPDFNRTFPDIPFGGYSSDQGTVSWIVPLVTFRSATHCNRTIGHNWIQVAQNVAPTAFKAGLTASKWMAATALDLLMNPQTVDRAWTEHEKRLEKTPYYHATPADIPVPTFFDLYGREWESVPKPPAYKEKK